MIRDPRPPLRLAALALALALGPRLVPAAEPARPTPTALDPVTLQFKWKHQFQFAGYYAALEKGYYREAGLDVTLREAEAERTSTDIVLAGEAEFGVAMSDLILLRAAGEPVVVLAAIFQHSPTILLAPVTTGIDHLHDLEGRRVAMEPHSVELLSYLESEGLPTGSYTTLPHGFGIDQLLSGEADAVSAYSTDEPFLLLQAEVPYATFTPRAAGIDFYGDVLFTTERQVRDHPERVAGFREASLAGWAYALAHPEEIVDLILDRYSTRHSREHLLFEARMTERLILPDVVELGYMNPGRWDHIANQFEGQGMVPAEFGLDGFIYAPDRAPELGWLYRALAIGIAVAALAVLLAGRFYALNRSLQTEIREHRATIRRLEVADDQINTLRGILPICMHCKGVRDDEGSWSRIEEYVSEHSEAEFSHGICETCLKEHYPDGTV